MLGQKTCQTLPCCQFGKHLLQRPKPIMFALGTIGSGFASHPVLPGCCRHLWVTSTQRLMVHFNPSALLSIGDALAFVTTLLSDQVVAQTKAGPQPVAASHIDHVSPTC